jgi:hypothetical protein
VTFDVRRQTKFPFRTSEALTQRKIAILLLALTVVAIAYPVVRTLLSVNAARHRRNATLTELWDYVAVLRENEWDIDSTLATQFEAAIDDLDHTLLPDLETPRLISAYVLPANMPRHPYYPHSINVWWLEEGFTVDGIALYIDGKVHATIIGWGTAMKKAPGKIERQFENRYDKYLVADVIFYDTQKQVRDFAFTLTEADRDRRLEIELMTPLHSGVRIPLLVGRSTTTKERDEP